MTLDDAIAHAREVAAGCGECAEEHAQLADWLDELRALKASNDDGEAMSMLGRQIKELWRMADELDEHSAFIGYCGSVSRDPFIRDAVFLMREAADTIESLRDRLQAAELGNGTCEQVLSDCNDGLMPPFTAHCSACGAEWGFTPRYCHNCGARVVGTRDERKAVKR